MSIEVAGVSKRFGDFVALDDVDLSIPTGQLTALLGPSGGGKTTLLRIIAGLESADSGSVVIEGVDTTGVPVQKRNVGFVFQHYAAFKHLSVRRNVSFGLEIRKRPKAEVEAKVDELLRLAIEPSVLLLDEPFGALDAKVRKELRDWLRRLHDEMHVTTVFVTHDQEEALEVADSIVVINDGRIEQVGTPDDLYDKPASDFVLSFLGPVTRLGDHLVRPHDIEISRYEQAAVTVGTITRWTRIGFEVRLEVTPEDARQPGPVLVSLTRTDATALGLHEGDRVWLRLRPGAS